MPPELVLKCEKEIYVVKRAPTGKVIERYHRKCGQPALRCTFEGLLTTTQATLCEFHRKLAAKEARLVDVQKR